MFCYIQGRKGGDSMPTKKDLVIALMATFCLTVSMFAIITVRSQTKPAYDPQLDINHDGVINILDIAAVAKAFGISGDPTKNVAVLNWQNPLDSPLDSSLDSYEVQYLGSFNCSWIPNVFEIHGQSGGYSKMTFYAEVRDMSYNGPFNFNITVSSMSWDVEENGSAHAWRWVKPFNLTMSFVEGFAAGWQQENAQIETEGPYFSAQIEAEATTPWLSPDRLIGLYWVTFDMYAYLRNS
jgi:hypothetical protein